MTWTTPGIDFLIRHVFIPASLNYAALYLGTYVLSLHAPQWLIFSGAVVLIPARLIASVVYTYRKHIGEAEARGARLPPVIDTQSFGNWKLMLRLEEAMTAGYPGDDFWDFVEQHGSTFNLRLGFEDVVTTIDPEYLKRILSTEVEKFEKGEDFRHAMESVLGSGIFNSDGAMWKFHRSLARPFFARDRVTDLERFDKHIQKGVQIMKARMETGYAIDFQDLMQRVTLDTSSEFFFGTCINSLEMSLDNLPLPYNHPRHEDSVQEFSNHPENAFSEALLKAQFIASQRDRVGWIWPLLEIFGDRTKKHMQVVNAFLIPVIKAAIAKNVDTIEQDETKEVNEEFERDGTFLDDLSRQTSDFTILKDQASNALVAARDTIASSATFLFCMLSQHPEVMARLRAEILNKVGPSRIPTYEDVKDMKYLRAVINETLRVLPPVHCANGAFWPSAKPNEKPLYIPPGSHILYSVLMMHTHEEYWGPDAAQFDPDRFLDERKKYLSANPFIFLPFNAGPRICLGQQLAYNQLSIIVIRFLQAFSSFTLVEAAFPPDARVPKEWNGEFKGRKSLERFRPKAVISMSSEGGMWLKALPVDQE
ncbi:cytochrome P450 monooxygenase pc-1 [Ephemerocybe angulata]|uniref:Cytochrome P450 monooxygenase pc-1 n=1 Tax=Ephemerocybe angulata TaxID=980116 RepID=A0A8H6HBW1_9AGAR|nr:cytochrome P450 monooxygenase pc-1 [Tulosesus angulatus]